MVSKKELWFFSKSNMLATMLTEKSKPIKMATIFAKTIKLVKLEIIKVLALAIGGNQDDIRASMEKFNPSSLKRLQDKLSVGEWYMQVSATVST
ncbi:hypothetical protein D3C76_1569710 [compost metagenome]